ncbi:thioredoxin domain-containing protein [Panacibacter ginsenosidivorans]|uniref:Thioredoxin domain-containing protein n=1 Tax=Panacibacter ginsenosidivorans TaxID=1813871 RepID=A0A5B8VFB2_9BACT|nr:thioredoxin domain-containing protein [Panacibacter ginsenosidivorans]
MEKKFTNRLIKETSPYLLQHAHNPVDWFPWGEEALQKAKEEDKPILVSIGYSACHWCHVMEKESFEDEVTADIMNKHFVNIKIDREERPDLDHVYMDAVQTMTGSGGWPLNVFLTPDTKPFYGGTYFPPVRAFNRMSWKETLYAINESYRDKRDEVESQAENLTQHIINANSFGISKKATDQISNFFSKDDLDLIAKNLLQSADKEWGGFGNAPKFPQTFSIQFLLRHYHFTKDDDALKQALLSIDKMMQGGIHDHLGGGFARYSTDAQWLAPHFEKMLYDNALLVSILAEAYQLTGQEKYSETIKKTLAFVERELTSPEGGFYSALDADSEGVEGKYYVWSKNEIDHLLGNDAELFAEVYGISGKGNWEHTNILWLKETIEVQAKKMAIDEIYLKNRLKYCREVLFKHRQTRIRPGLDDKILLGWNALMITACCKAYAATGDAICLDMAVRNIRFLETNLRDSKGNWLHTWKNNQSKYLAFLDDYAFLMQAYIHLQEVTGRQEYLFAARNILTKTIDEFSDEDDTFFFFTSVLQEDIILRKKEVYDGAVPSGNAVMAFDLLYLAMIFNERLWLKRAEKMLISLDKVVIKYPYSFSYWAGLWQHMVTGINEIAVTGENAFTIASLINKNFIPNKIMQSAILPTVGMPLLEGKFNDENETYIYLCRNYTCERPLKIIDDLILLLKN